jgi:hypothetical protein
MPKLMDSINWISNGERGNETVFNRPLKEIATLIDTNQIQTPSRSLGKIVPSEEVSTLTDGDVVQVLNDGTYTKATEETGVLEL